MDAATGLHNICTEIKAVPCVDDDEEGKIGPQLDNPFVCESPRVSTHPNLLSIYHTQDILCIQYVFST